MKSLSAIIIITFFSAAVIAQAGTLDSNFSSDGVLRVSIGGIADNALSMAIQPNGKIIAAGWSQLDSDLLHTGFSLMQLNSDGTLDNTFGTGGKLITSFDYFDHGWSVQIQADGKIIAGGISNDSLGNISKMALVRFNPDGTLDSSFADNGKLISDSSWGVDACFAIALQADGKILAAGGWIDAAFVIVRFHSDGSLDSSFNGTGIVSIPISLSSTIDALLVQEDEKILAAGYVWNGNDYDLLVARFNSDGTRDTNFGINGILTDSIPDNWEMGYSIAKQNDGKIVVGGTSFYSDTLFFYLARINENGIMDSLFGNNGVVITNMGSYLNDAQAVVIEPDQKIILAGKMNLDFALARYNANGLLDSSFGFSGKVITSINGSNSGIYASALQTDGKLVAVGYAAKNSETRFAAARYILDLALGEINFSNENFSSLIYPNPIQLTEQLEYTLTQDEVLTLSLCDMNGRVIKNFFTQQKRTAGAHKEQLNMGALAAGNYFLTLSNGEQKITVKMVKQ